MNPTSTPSSRLLRTLPAPHSWPAEVGGRLQSACARLAAPPPTPSCGGEAPHSGPFPGKGVRTGSAINSFLPCGAGGHRCSVGEPGEPHAAELGKKQGRQGPAAPTQSGCVDTLGRPAAHSSAATRPSAVPPCTKTVWAWLVGAQSP